MHEALAHLEMQLRRGDGPGGADPSDPSALPHAIALSRQKSLVMGVGRDIIVRVLD